MGLKDTFKKVYQKIKGYITGKKKLTPEEKRAIAIGRLRKIKKIRLGINKVKKEFVASRDKQKQHLPKTNGLSSAIGELNEAVNAPVKPVMKPVPPTMSPSKKAARGFAQYQAKLKRDGQELTPKQAFAQFSKEYPKSATIIRQDLQQREMNKEFQAMQAEDRKSGLIASSTVALKPKVKSKALSPEFKQLIDDGNRKYDQSLEAKSLKGSPQERASAAKELDMRRRLDKLKGIEPSSSLSAQSGNAKGPRR